MEIVKQYLEKRIEELNELYIDAIGSDETNKIILISSGIAELKQVLTLFNEEYEKNEEKLSILNDVISDMQSELFSRER